MGKFQQRKPKTEIMRKESDNKPGSAVKKPFDKAKWREQKYSNKAKLNRFEERRRHAVLRDYYKEVKKTGTASAGPHNLTSTSKHGRDGSERPLSAYEMAKKESERLAKEKEEKRLEKERVREERKAALTKYKEKKKNHYSKLSKKTERGQPVMAGRMELLLEKIQRSCT